VNYKRLTVLFGFFFFVAILGQAQFIPDDDTTATNEPAKPSVDWKEKLVFGGNFGFVTGQNLTEAEVSPMIGYRVDKRLLLGNYLIFQYYGYRDYISQFSTTIYGTRPFAQYLLFNNINQLFSDDDSYSLGFYGRIESELLNLDRRYFGNPYLIGFGTRMWIETLLVGVGLQEDYGGTGLNISILWDVSQNIYYPYANPQIRFGFYF
jgi:hypothetical protein